MVWNVSEYDIIIHTTPITDDCDNVFVTIDILDSRINKYTGLISIDIWKNIDNTDTCTTIIGNTENIDIFVSEYIEGLKEYIKNLNMEV